MSVLHQLSLLLLLVLYSAQNTGLQHYKILGALPIGSAKRDINRFSKALKHFETNFTGTVNWALFHYQDIDVWKSQPWYNNPNLVLSIHESGFKYYYFYKYVTVEYITNLYEYDWIWLMVSDCDFGVFDAQTFVHYLSLWNPGVAQPANTGYNTWFHTLRYNPSNVRVTNLVDVGPLLSIRVELWELFRGLMNPNFSSGWGVDHMLCTYIAKTHGYTLNPNNQTDGFGMPLASVWLWAYKNSVKKRGVRRAQQRVCPLPMSFNPACIIVDASPLTHLDFQEGEKSGRHSTTAFLKDIYWYRHMYPKYWVFDKDVVSYCTSSL